MDKVVLASVEWPPYSSVDLPEKGAMARTVREAFAEVGLELEIRFYPWNRLLQEAASNPDIQGYFPEYQGRKSGFLYSNTIGHSPLGLAKQADDKRSWYTHSDLERYTIGVVSGYLNTRRFDTMVDEGNIRISKASFDKFNLRKVLEKRIDMAVVDINVYRHLIWTDPLLSARRGSLVIDPHLLGINELFVCFPDTEKGVKLRSLFNKGLQRLDIRKLQREYIKWVQAFFEGGLKVEPQ